MILQKAIRIVRTSRVLQTVFLQQFLIAVRSNVQKVKFGGKTFILGAPLVKYITGKVEPKTQDNMENKILEADALFEQGQYQKLYEKFKNEKDGQSDEMLWRLARALYHLSKEANAQEAKDIMFEAYELVSKALSIKEDNAQIHKWYAVLLDSKCAYEGKKARIQQLQTTKDHMLRSYELNPKDATILYMLGNWCYHVADLAWYQRKIAAVIFADPPNSSFEEALQFLLKAEETDPNFYSQNLLLVGKTYLKLNNKEEARKYLKRASEYQAKNMDDREATQEATKLLSSL